MPRVTKASLRWLLVVALTVFVLCAVNGFAAEEESDEGLPLPLHTIEGVGGRVITPTAYLTNPGGEDALAGKPAVSAGYAMVGEKDLQTFAATWTLWDRLELGYGFNRLGLHDFDQEIRHTFGADLIRTNEIYLHHLNARLNLIKEGAWDISCMPALTAGAHYKYNNDIDKINRDLGDALEDADYSDNDGVDFTLTASKKLALVPELPIIVSGGLRASRASQFGLLGFTNEYLGSFEANIAAPVTKNIVVGAEYRQKPEALGRVPDLVAHDDSWWDVHAAYIFGPNAVLYAVAGDAGGVANHTDEMFYGMVFKYDF